MGSLVAAAVAFARGRRAAALATLRRLALSALAYLAVVAGVSVASPHRVVRVGEDQCSDDWCIAVTRVTKTPAAGHGSYEVTFRLSSRARRATQRERNVVVYLTDDQARRYNPDPIASGPPFDVELGPMQEVSTTRVFSLPGEARDVGAVITRGGGTPFPGCCIIGDNDSLLHRKAIVRLE